MDAVELMEPPNKINVVHERSVIIGSVTAKVLFQEYGLRHRQTCQRKLEEIAMSSWLQSLQMHEILIYGLVFGLPVVAIGFSEVVAIVKALICHRERLAMIEHGLDPDDNSEYSNAETSPSLPSGKLDETQPYVPRKWQTG
jgi:hypothetical protein